MKRKLIMGLLLFGAAGGIVAGGLCLSGHHRHRQQFAERLADTCVRAALVEAGHSVQAPQSELEGRWELRAQQLCRKLVHRYVPASAGAATAK